VSATWDGPPGQPCACPNLAGDCDGAHTSALPDAAVTAEERERWLTAHTTKPVPGDNQQAAESTQAAEYAIRARANHGGPLDRVCQCGTPLCPQQFLLRHIESLKDAHLALTQKLADETAAAPVIAAQAAAAERERLKPLIREKIAQLWVRQPFTSMTAERMNAEVDTIVADLIRARDTA
jgi:hypothetical protein